MTYNILTKQSCLRAAIYARVSSELQVQQCTIDSQIEALRERVQNDGLTLEEELTFIDDGYTGSTLLRPALERLRDVAWAGGFQRLYIHSPDRLARKYAWQVLLVEELQRSGIEIIFLNRTIGVSPEEDLLLQMQGVIAEYERAKIMERSRRGKRHSAQRGSVSVLCCAPYGYRYLCKHECGGQAQYQVNLEEASVVKQIFEWIGHDRMSIRQVCRRLNEEEGIASAKGKLWSVETVRKLLGNPAYKGQAVFGKTRSVDRRSPLRPGRGRPEHPRTSMSRIAGKPEEQFTIQVPPIVAEVLFDAVAEQLVENRKRSRQNKRGPVYLLQGLIECANCGYAYYGKGGTRFALNNNAPYPYYRCAGTDTFRYSGVHNCTNKPIRLDRLDAAVWADACAVLQNPGDLRKEFERRIGGDDQPDINIAQLNKQMTATQRSISRLIDAYEDGVLDKGEFEPRIRKVKERQKRLEQEIATTSDYATKQSELRLVLGQLDKFAEQVRQGLDHADWNTRREIIRSLVKVVKVEEQHIRITYRVSPRPFVDGCSGSQIWQHCQHRVFGDHQGDSRQGRCFPIQQS
jgi:site-specific DNA recombinase